EIVRDMRRGEPLLSARPRLPPPAAPVSENREKPEREPGDIPQSRAGAGIRSRLHYGRSDGNGPMPRKTRRTAAPRSKKTANPPRRKRATSARRPSQPARKRAARPRRYAWLLGSA